MSPLEFLSTTVFAAATNTLRRLPYIKMPDTGSTSPALARSCLRTAIGSGARHIRPLRDAGILVWWGLYFS